MLNKKIQILAQIWEKGMNQTTLSKAVGCSEARLSRILNSHVKPSKNEIVAIANTLDVEASFLEELLVGGDK